MTVTASKPAPAAAPGFGRLVGAEFRRLRSRRFTKLLLGLSVLGYLVAGLFIWFSHVQTGPDELAAATATRDQLLVEQQQYHDQCLAEQAASNNSDSAEGYCGMSLTEDSFPLEQFLDKQPFSPRNVAPYALAVGAAVALAGFVLAASSIGAEWSSKNIVAWLFYEPRRLRLMGAKLLALLSALLVLAVLAQVIWFATAQLLISYRGVPVTSLPAEDQVDFWSKVLQVHLRAMLLVIPAGVLGFGLANLLRNTAAATGIAFVYFVVMESTVRSVFPALQPYLFQTAVAAWVTDGGIDVYGELLYDRDRGGLVPDVIHVSNLTGGLVLLAWAGVVLLVSLTLFRRRDIS